MTEFTDAEAWALKEAREASDTEISSYVLPGQATGPEISEVYSRLLDLENELFPDGNYAEGIANRADRIRVIAGNRPVLLTAEHASIQMRKGEPKEADMGTGGLSTALSQDTNSTSIIALGCQTRDANYDKEHPVKEVMEEIIVDDDIRAHFALHMLNRGRAYEVNAKHGFSVMLGLGKEPSDATMTAKDIMIEQGRDMGLAIDANRGHIVFDKDNNRLRRNEDGSLKYVTFAAAGPNTTQTFSQNLAKKLGKDAIFAALQVEISEVLLVRQNKDNGAEVEFPSQSDRELGPFMGYMFMKLSLDKIILELGL